MFGSLGHSFLKVHDRFLVLSPISDLGLGVSSKGMGQKNAYGLTGLLCYGLLQN